MVLLNHSSCVLTEHTMLLSVIPPIHGYVARPPGCAYAERGRGCREQPNQRRRLVPLKRSLELPPTSSTSEGNTTTWPLGRLDLGSSMDFYSKPAVITYKKADLPLLGTTKNEAFHFY